MENASKALLIAGGILIAVILLSLFVSMYNRMSSFEKKQEEQTKMTQIQEHNAEFEAFDKRVMFGTDVITLANKVENNNKKYQYDNDFQVKMYLNDVEVKEGKTLLTSDDDFKTKMFKCNSIKYNSAGIVNEIYIVNYK